MPGYRYGVKEILTSKVADVPRQSALKDLDPRALIWFEESVDSDSANTFVPTELRLPATRYAVSLQGGSESVVYAEQCLSADFCFTWQRWPAIPPGPKATR